MRLTSPPNWFVNLVTIGIVRARWIAESNRRLALGGAGFWFAWFLLPFANYGLAQRMTVALRAAGSGSRVSAMACFFLTGWPFIGSNKRLKRGAQAINDAAGVAAHAAPSAAL